MIIEFKCENFRSIQNEQTLSLVAQNTDKSKLSCTIKKSVPGLAGLNFLRGIAIYGANASGKTNLIDAISFMANFVENSALPTEGIKVEPFKLDSKWIEKPTKFEISFIAEEIRYQYGFSVNAERVLDEYIIAYPKGFAQRWYHRFYDVTKQNYIWEKSSLLKGDKRLQENTRDNSLFLSVAAQFNHPQLTAVFNWFKYEIVFLHLGADWNLPWRYTAKTLLQLDDSRELLNLLKNADFGINDVKVDEKNYTDDEIMQLNPNLRGADDVTINQYKDRMKYAVKFTHATSETEGAELDLMNEESAGTRRFFSLIGPWLATLKKGYTLFVDEIETSLHPILIKELFKLLLCDIHNPEGAQVIFTTHNPVLLDGEIFRRDQIWFTEKDGNGATQLYPLTDYKPRVGEALVKGYMAGRYGAIPFIPMGLDYGKE
jgi:uncharacterized protein